jgi:hypothetical protein
MKGFKENFTDQAVGKIYVENENQSRTTKSMPSVIVIEIKIRRVDWLGHVIRMEDTSTVKQKAEGKTQVKMIR